MRVVRAQRLSTAIAIVIALTCVVVVAASGTTRFPPDLTAEARSSQATRGTTPDAHGNDPVDLSDPPLHFAVPHGWDTFNLTKQTLDDLTQRIERNNPALASYLSERMVASAAGNL
jgi:hypothetical protein